MIKTDIITVEEILNLFENIYGTDHITTDIRGFR